ncbi:galactose-1-phosphate uridyl transferase [Serendipita sp. 398]|nr:galactose-1-phosphate uridyl transferase [Serendipita sp. 398]
MLPMNQFRRLPNFQMDDLACSANTLTTNYPSLLRRGELSSGTITGWLWFHIGQCGLLKLCVSSHYYCAQTLKPRFVVVLPHHRHITSLDRLADEEIVTFAAILSQLTIRYDNLFSTSFAYSMGIHQRPIPSRDPSTFEAEDVAHLHLHFNPPLVRSATIRKFLVGFEMMGEPQRDLTPEQAAVRLRECSEIHYSKIEA